MADVGQQDGELVAAHAAHRVHPPDRALDRSHSPPEELIARGVALRVVHGLEVLEVEHHHRQGLAAAHGPVELGGDALLEPAPV